MLFFNLIIYFLQMKTKYIIIQIFIQKNKMNSKFLMMDLNNHLTMFFFYILNYYHLFIYLFILYYLNTKIRVVNVLQNS
ncbi:hypothetical protein GLOIN_2v989486 [Rhizophagus irregularis DAOM 181602=DAOM 197198]|uniref:Uncharacterized protein n=1 Tax=Rhizophagus irregularis (strain DAOM 181602 / DAOM 197198 / MUCL 43194) TaxID=747089 RepID=A0A2P4QCD8_RHIID|nr:hypothetical protein GLOIN_2v989486 [Rhizophagus irregularis DAOM 181602=DAOM 197198]POG75274.1 hypothetical protein GLOIN_2v989486 [Rhizophagus irregularis DAOM 181602=DAOM 197198]|eukprot:XP_025182140.1 hypothetical protein GLOIN_2v989486 [Rhizophagus irregularis DAOM 181602=DAOM 197198]